MTKLTDQQIRIKLAEAMKVEYWRSEVFGDALGLPDPLNDANDDYAVLEWMRRGEGDADTYGRFKNIFEGDYIDGIARWYLYEIGDYARAALKEMT